MSSSEPELVRAKASFKLWKEGQHQDRDLRMIVGHFSVLAGIETALERRVETAKKASAPRRPPPCRPPPPDYIPTTSYEDRSQHVEVAVVEMDDAVDDSDDDFAADSSDDNDSVAVTEAPIEGGRIS